MNPGLLFGVVLVSWLFGFLFMLFSLFNPASGRDDSAEFRLHQKAGLLPDKKAQVTNVYCRGEGSQML